MNLKRILAAGLLAVFAAIGIANAAGWLTNGLPTQSTTAWSGTELMPVDTNYAGGRAPQTIGAGLPQINALSAFTLTDAATITPSGIYNLFTVTLGGNRTIDNVNPDPPPNGIFRIVVIQDATGSRSVTWGTKYKWVGFTAPTLTTTARRADLITCIAYSFTGNYICDKQLNIQP